MPHDPITQYNHKIESGELEADTEQAEAAAALQRLYSEIMEERELPKLNWFQRTTGLGRRAGPYPKGLHIYGGPGRGKSMLMDMFFDCLPDDIIKRRVHFHEFMIEVHDYIHSRREVENINEGVDVALPMLAERIAERARVLCFDEFHVTDVADAMILGRLFTALLDHDVIIVATSNWPPDELYKGGLQRDRFLPFIALLKNRLEVIHLDSPTDYRDQEIDENGTYFWPLGRDTDRRIEALFARLSENAPVKSAKFTVKGRAIRVPKTAGGIARFTFSQLCEKPLGAEDYLGIARRYHTVFLENIPILTPDKRNEAKRLMILIDSLYENGTILAISAEAPPEKLYSGKDHGFEFERTISRLLEMQSSAYSNQSANA